MNNFCFPKVTPLPGEFGDPSSLQCSIHVVGSKKSWKLEVRAVQSRARHQVFILMRVTPGTCCFGGCAYKCRCARVHFLTRFMISRCSFRNFLYWPFVTFQTATSFRKFYVNPPTLPNHTMRCTPSATICHILPLSLLSPKSLKHLSNNLAAALPYKQAGMFVPPRASIVQNGHRLPSCSRRFDQTQTRVC
jgi:hypothetical protein